MQPQGSTLNNSQPHIPPQLANSADQSVPSTAPQFLQSAPNSSQTFPGIASPVTATDSDLIEKEWVAAVKAVIEDHKDDPYVQSRTMLMLRADYMKKRYGKDIKIPEN